MEPYFCEVSSDALLRTEVMVAFRVAGRSLQRLCTDCSTGSPCCTPKLSQVIVDLRFGKWCLVETPSSLAIWVLTYSVIFSESSSCRNDQSAHPNSIDKWGIKLLWERLEWLIWRALEEKGGEKKQDQKEMLRLTETQQACPISVWSNRLTNTPMFLLPTQHIPSQRWVKRKSDIIVFSALDAFFHTLALTLEILQLTGSQDHFLHFENFPFMKWARIFSITLNTWLSNCTCIEHALLLHHLVWIFQSL